MIKLLEIYKGPGRRVKDADNKVKEIVLDEPMERAHDRGYREWLIATGKIVPSDDD